MRLSVHSHCGTKSAAGLLERHRLGDHQFCTQTESDRNPGPAVYNGYGRRAAIQVGTTHGLKQKVCVVLMIAIDHDEIKGLGGQAFRGESDIVELLEGDLKLAEDLADRVQRLLITAQNKRTGGHSAC